MGKSRRPPIKLPPGEIERIYERIGLCYECGMDKTKCKHAIPAPLPHRTPADYDSTDLASQAENDRLSQWFEDNWDNIPEIPL